MQHPIDTMTKAVNITSARPLAVSLESRSGPPEGPFTCDRCGHPHTIHPTSSSNIFLRYQSLPPPLPPNTPKRESNNAICQFGQRYSTEFIFSISSRASRLSSIYKQCRTEYTIGCNGAPIIPSRPVRGVILHFSNSMADSSYCYDSYYRDPPLRSTSGQQSTQNAYLTQLRCFPWLYGASTVHSIVIS